jgi:hypothetical protein
VKKQGYEEKIFANANLAQTLTPALILIILAFPGSNTFFSHHLHPTIQ